MSALSLYEIAAEYRQMVEHLLDTQDDAQTVADTLEAEAYPLEAKAQQVAYAIKTLQANAAAIKEAEEAMAKRRKAMENRAENILEYLHNCMTTAGIQRIDCPHFAIAIKKKPASVEIFDAAQIPPAYLRFSEPPPPAPDKAAIKEAIKSGKEVPGAKLSDGATRIEIK